MPSWICVHGPRLVKKNPPSCPITPPSGPPKAKANPIAHHPSAAIEKLVRILAMIVPAFLPREKPISRNAKPGLHEHHQAGGEDHPHRVGPDRGVELAVDRLDQVGRVGKRSAGDEQQHCQSAKRDRRQVLPLHCILLARRRPAPTVAVAYAGQGRRAAWRCVWTAGANPGRAFLTDVGAVPGRAWAGLPGEGRACRRANPGRGTFRAALYGAVQRSHVPLPSTGSGGEADRRQRGAGVSPSPAAWLQAAARAARPRRRRCAAKRCSCHFTAVPGRCSPRQRRSGTPLSSE